MSKIHLISKFDKIEGRSLLFATLDQGKADLIEERLAGTGWSVQHTEQELDTYPEDGILCFSLCVEFARYGNFHDPIILSVDLCDKPSLEGHLCDESLSLELMGVSFRDVSRRAKEITRQIVKKVKAGEIIMDPVGSSVDLVDLVNNDLLEYPRT
jgi:hypothetical protein